MLEKLIYCLDGVLNSNVRWNILLTKLSFLSACVCVDRWKALSSRCDYKCHAKLTPSILAIPNIRQLIEDASNWLTKWMFFTWSVILYIHQDVRPYLQSFHIIMLQSILLQNFELKTLCFWILVQIYFVIFLSMAKIWNVLEQEAINVCSVSTCTNYNLYGSVPFQLRWTYSHTRNHCRI